MTFSDKKILVCGMMRSGYAAARFLLSHGALVTVSDMRPALPDEFSDVANNPNCSLYLGKNPDDIVQNYDMVIISPGVPIDTPFILKANALGIPVLGELELGSLFTRANIAAITGTNGKTTAATITGNIFSLQWPGSRTLGNIGTPITAVAEDMSADLWISLETSSFQLESIHKFHPRISCVLNISEDHLNRHYT
ncbi:MAG: Mur ligase family protein, partial [Defluviitaleaceae bacterium]|nr:Mur ligase family protein [Defluviitaleaceae bacterium]